MYIRIHISLPNYMQTANEEWPCETEENFRKKCFFPWGETGPHTIFNTAYKPLHQTSLVVQWLRLHAPNAEDQGLIPGQGSRSHMPKLRAQMLQLKIPHVAMKTPHLATKSQQTQIKKKKSLI